MRQSLLFLFLLVFLNSSAQHTTNSDDMKDTPPDSTVAIKPIEHTIGVTPTSEEDARRNIENVLRLSQEIEQRKKKEKTQAMIRIGIGVLFLAVLVIGLMRRRKKAA
jgi:hypothetical protein